MAKNTGINRKLETSSEMSDFLGHERDVTRGEVVKAIWAHVKKKKLKLETGGFKPDAALKPVLGSGVIKGVGDVSKKITKHLLKIEA